MPITNLAHAERMLKHLEGEAMGLKYTVETVGELRKALAHIPDDVPFQVVCDDADYRKLEIQSHYDHEPERFVKMEAVDQ